MTASVNSAVLTSRKVLALKDGTVAYCGAAEEFMKKEILEKIYEKPFSLMKHPKNERTIVIPEVP